MTFRSEFTRMVRDLSPEHARAIRLIGLFGLVVVLLSLGWIGDGH
jgi:hypothetical protein